MRITRLFWAYCLVLCTGFFAVGASSQLPDRDMSSSTQIKNPFHKTAKWKLWRIDPRPVTIGATTLSPPPTGSRRYPVDLETQGGDKEFLAFRGSDWQGHRYAGMWDDVYASFDSRHSYIPALWHDESGNEVQLRGQHMHLIYGFSRDPRRLWALGLNFTSQSTSGMGHNLTDSFEDIDNLERNFCFANILRAGPAHISYRDETLVGALDQYDAIMPCFFNSIGSSGSEVNALAKMLIVGAHFPAKTKLTLKRHGLYIPTLLYLWKAGLPYDVPYTNELRHRVVYASSGNSSDRLLDVRAPLNQSYHRYNETAHLRNMVNMAKAMDIAPPIALLTKREILGGIEKSVNRTTIRVHQKLGKSTRLRISAADSFDLQGYPLTYQWSVLYENTPAKIKVLDDGREALITVPFDPKLPKGRTVILLTVNNGYYDSNPATINIYRPFGADNQRPSLTGLSDRTVLAGESIRFNITSHDPEGFSSTLYRWSNEVGSLDGNQFTWTTPDVPSLIQKHIHVIATDGTSAYNSGQATLTVTPTLAVLQADRSEGKAPLKVRFSAGQSRDKAGNVLAYAWDFDDGHTAAGPEIMHTFTNPGFYQVSLTASGPFGPHTVKHVVHVHHDWSKVLDIDNRWHRQALDPKVWTPIRAEGGVSLSRAKGVTNLHITGKNNASRDELSGVESASSIDVPLYLEARFSRAYVSIGSGYEVLGNLIGKLGRTKFGDMSIGYQQTDGNWTGSYIGRHLRADPIVTQLRLFVDQDPDHPGRIRYAGYLESILGRQFFQVGNQQKRGDRLRIQTRGPNGWFDTQAFQVWTPR